jgi:hypothetical protein
METSRCKDVVKTAARMKRAEIAGSEEKGFGLR